MAVNKVVLNTTAGAQVLIDLTMLTVTPETLAEGVLAINAAGELIVGTHKCSNDTDNYTNIIDSVGYSDGQRLSTSSGTLKEATGYVTTGLIDIMAESYPVTIRTRGVNFTYASYPYSSFVFYNADGSMIGAHYTSTTGNNYFSNSVDSNGNMTLVLSNSNYGRLKLCGYGSGADLIVTVNEEIS